MRKKYAPVSIDGVKVFETKESRYLREIISRSGIPVVNEGTTFAFNLNPNADQLGKPKILLKESSITCLCYLPGRGVYGGISDTPSRLFVLPRTMVPAMVATMEDYQNIDCLISVKENILFGVAWTIKGTSHFFLYNASDDYYDCGSFWFKVRGKFIYLGAPLGNERVSAITVQKETGLIYGLTLQNSLFCYDINNKKIKIKLLISKEPISSVLTFDNHENIYGVGPEGFLYRYNITKKKIEHLKIRIPTQKGHSYVAVASQLLPPRNNIIYGATRGDGYLFAYDLKNGEIFNLGKPLNGGLHLLTFGVSGKIYGIAGEGLHHLFYYRENTRTFMDLGVVSAWVPNHWIGHEFCSIAGGEFGEVYLGEKGNLSHLFVYFPPVEY